MDGYQMVSPYDTNVFDYIFLWLTACVDVINGMMRL